MAVPDPSDLDRIDQEIRINELKHEAEELSGGPLASYEADDCPADMAEAFWRRVVEYEKAPQTCDFVRLTERGVELPDPNTLNDLELTAKLWDVIHRLATLRTFLSNTNHLSDRELYTHLVTETLWEANPELPFDEDSACHLDILGGCSEEDMHLYLKHYADEEWRNDWHARWPDDPMPAHEDPPYDRDRHLPKAEW